MRIFAVLFLSLVLFSACNHEHGKLRAAVKVDGKFGYIDERGNFIVDPKFEDAWSFIRGSAVVKKDGKYGLIDKEGKYIVEPKFDSMIPFSATCYIAEKDSLFGFFENGTGKFILQPQFNAVFKYTEDLCAVQRGHALGLVNSKGELVCPVVLQDFHEMFGPGAVVVKQDTSDEVQMLLSLIQGGVGAKLGLINSKGKLIVEPKYDDMFDDLDQGYYYPFIHDSDAVCDTNLTEDTHVVPKGKYGILDTLGNLIAPPLFDELPVFGDGLFRVRVGDHYGFVDTQGKVVIPARYEYAIAFSEGKTMVTNGNKTSIIDKTGKVIAAQTEAGAGVYRFKNGLARYHTPDDKYGFINATGKAAIRAQFDVADDFDNNRAIVALNKKYGLIDRAGNFVIPPNFSFIFDLGEGYYQTKDENEKVGVVDSAGKEILAPQFDEVFHLQKPWFIVEKDSLNGCYTVSGKEIFPPQSLLHIYFIDGRCTVMNSSGKTGIIDSTGKTIVPMEYDSIGYFFRGYATIKKDRRFGAIDSTGKLAIEPKYDAIGPVINGFSVFSDKGKFGYIDSSGNEVIGAKFDEAAVFVDPDRKEFN